jgi:hypothetical protein
MFFSVRPAFLKLTNLQKLGQNMMILLALKSFKTMIDIRYTAFDI